MSQFSKTTLKKLKSHLGKLKSSSKIYEANYLQSKNKNTIHTSVALRNKNLVKILLMESNFLNFENLKFNSKSVSLTNGILLNNKNLFINKNLYKKSYLINQKQNRINFSIKKLYYLFKKSMIYLNKNLEDLVSIYSSEIKSLRVFYDKETKEYYRFLKFERISKLHIYCARFLIISILHFIPFVQLTTTLFYNQPNKQIVHPILSHLFNFVPFLVPIINITTPVLNQDTISFLLLVPYLYFFIYSFRKYNISRKIAYQGSFALALMLFRYSLILSQEALTVIYKFTKRLFFLRNYKNIELLRDEITFYIDDLEEMRSYREDFFQLGESIFSLADTTKITKLWECTTLLSLLGVIALLYNYMYFIFRGQKPIIPIVTKTVQRMMIDRKGKES